MSILIKGMDMPKGCWWQENGFYMECPLFDADHYCSQLRRWIKSDDGDRPHDCPLVEVPTPHGRLIDADAAIDDIRREILEWRMNGIKGTPPYTSDLRTTWERLEDEDIIPTIIEAEEK